MGYREDALSAAEAAERRSVSGDGLTPYQRDKRDAETALGAQLEQSVRMILGDDAHPTGTRANSGGEINDSGGHLSYSERRAETSLDGITIQTARGGDTNSPYILTTDGRGRSTGMIPLTKESFGAELERRQRRR